jgi:hypothetical protein
VSSQSTTQLAHFEVEVIVVDHPTERRRWNGGPMPSEDTTAALSEAVDAFKRTLIDHGFDTVRTTYGVHATEVVNRG